MARSKALVRKQAVTIRYDPDIIAAYRAAGPGWQTRINDTLKHILQSNGGVPPELRNVHVSPASHASASQASVAQTPGLQAPTALPADVAPYKCSPEFNEHTLPQALRHDHNTKPGVWALIHVLEGELRYCVPQWQHDIILRSGQHGIVAPQVKHFVEPRGPMRMFVEFYAHPAHTVSSPHEAAISGTEVF